MAATSSRAVTTGSCESGTRQRAARSLAWPPATARCWRRAMRPTGQRLALGFADGTLLLTNASLGRTARSVAERLARASTRWRSVATVSGSPRLCTMARSAFWARMAVARFRSSADTAAPCWGLTSTATGAESSAPGRTEASGLWDTSTGQGPASSTRVGATRTDVRFSPDGSLILAVGSDGWMRLWNSRTTRARAARTRQHRASWTTQRSAPTAAEYAVSGKDGVIRVWSVAGRSACSLWSRGQLSRVFDLGFGPANRVVSAGDDGTVRIWNVEHTQSWIEPGQPKALDFSPDGRYLAAPAPTGPSGSRTRPPAGC